MLVKENPFFYDRFLEKADEYVEVVRNIKNPNKGIYALEEVQLTAALPNPSSIRDFYAFEQHVKQLVDEED